MLLVRKLFEVLKRFIKIYSCYCEYIKNFGIVFLGISIFIFGLVFICEENRNIFINESYYLIIRIF